MTLITCNPRKSIVSDVDRWFDSFWNFDYRSDSGYRYQPLFDIQENERSYIVSADLPGIEKKDVNISISEGEINISGERKTSENDDYKAQGYHSSQCGKFEKSFYLPDDANSDKVSAKMSNGVLSLEIQKAKKIPADIKKISIK